MLGNAWAGLSYLLEVAVVPLFAAASAAVAAAMVAAAAVVAACTSTLAGDVAFAIAAEPDLANAPNTAPIVLSPRLCRPLRPFALLVRPLLVDGRPSLVLARFFDDDFLRPFRERVDRSVEANHAS